MAEMLRSATPITNKNIVQPVREHRSDEAAFNLQELGRITQPNAQSELLGQNNAFMEQDSPLQVMAELFRDPGVTLTYIRNIALLRDIVGLLPMHNTALTEEFEQLFAQLMLSPEQITAELILQEEASTTFRGKEFDFLRSILSGAGSEEKTSAVVNLLKAVYSETNRREILDALSGSFSYLSQAFASSKDLAVLLKGAAAKFAAANAGENFQELKQETLEALETIEGSILFNDSHKRLVSMIRYNLSRYNDNAEFLPDAVRQLSEMLENTADKERLIADFIKHGSSPADNASPVMHALTKILGKQLESEEIKPFQFETLKNIVYSILSSPSNFTPLLHYIIPVDDGDTQAFAEMWINPDEENAQGESTGNVHILIAFDIADTGKFEAELLVRDKNIRLLLYCPSELTGLMQGYSSEIARCIKFSEYKFSEVRIAGLEKHRSLMEVFPDLPGKRSGLNVKI